MNNYTLPDNIAIIIPVIIAIVIILILIKMNIIKLDCLSCKDDSSESLDCHYKKGEKIENFNNYLSDYPPNQEPSKIYNISKTNIIVEYNTSFDTFDTYEIYTSYTYDGRRDGQGDGKGGGDIINLVDTDINTSWASLNNVYFPDKGYTGSNYLVNDTKGEWIYYKLPKKIRLNSYVISSIYNSPQTWIFYGSNDGKNWIEINDASQKDIVGRNWKEFNDASQIYFNKKKELQDENIL